MRSRPTLQRLASFVAVSALLAAVLAPSASADGDPASDVLLGQNVFYPYSPPVSPQVQKKLDATTTAAQRANFPLKVALIASPVDLGVIPDLFGKPQKYADFLDQEISFQGKQPLLVVMSTGYGVQGVNGNTASAVASLAKPAGGQSDSLANAAITAVAKLANAAGHPLKGGAGGSQPRNSSTGLVLGLVAAAALAAAALAAVMLRRRRPTRAGSHG